MVSLDENTYKCSKFGVNETVRKSVVDTLGINLRARHFSGRSSVCNKQKCLHFICEIMSALWIVISLTLTLVQLVRCQELVFANTLCRHGDRSIYRQAKILFFNSIASVHNWFILKCYRPYKTDPWAAEEFWPNGFAQLTNVCHVILWLCNILWKCLTNIW